MIFMFMFLASWYLTQKNVCCFELVGGITRGEIVSREGRYNKHDFYVYVSTVMVFTAKKCLLLRAGCRYNTLRGRYVRP